jgi:predicted Zn-ribbon and HTH transcriptional regulator
MNPIVESIRTRILKRNKNWLGIVVGDTGSGKSFSAIRLAQAIDPGFTIDRVVFNPNDFIALIRSDLPRGSAIVFDEAGVGMPSREWYSIQNKVLGYVLQTFRYKNYAVIFTVPSIDFVDVQARKLFHAYIETCGINYSIKAVKLKYKIPRYNNHMNKWFWIYPRIKGKRFETLWLGKPDKSFIKLYELKKRTEAEKLLVTANQETKAVEIAKPIQRRPITCYRCGHEWETKTTAVRIKCPSCYSTLVRSRNGISPELPVLPKYREEGSEKKFEEKVTYGA